MWRLKVTQYEKEKLAWMQLQMTGGAMLLSMKPDQVLDLFNRCLELQEANRQASYVPAKVAAKPA